MRRTKWTQTYRSASRPLLVGLCRSPHSKGEALYLDRYHGADLWSRAEDERRLLNVSQTVDYFFEQCEDTVRHTNETILHWLSSYRRDQPYRRPVILPSHERTRKVYRSTWKKFLYFLLRLYRLGSVAQISLLGLELTEAQRMPVQKTWDVLHYRRGKDSTDSGLLSPGLESIDSKLSPDKGAKSSCPSSTDTLADDIESTPNSECNDSDVQTTENSDIVDTDDDDYDGEDDEEDKLMSEEGEDEECDNASTSDLSDTDTASQEVDLFLADHIGRLSLTFLSESVVDGQLSTTLLVYFSGILGMSPDGLTFLRPRNFTSKLSALIYCIRLLVLERTLPRFPHTGDDWPQRPRHSQVLELNQLRQETLCYGVQAPVGEFLSLRAYGRSLANSEGAVFKFFWSDDGRRVTWSGMQSTVDDFQRLGENVLDAATQGCN